MLRLARFLRPYGWGIGLAILLEAASSVAELALPALMAAIVDGGILAGDVAAIWRYGGVMLAIAVAGGAANVLGGLFASRTSTGVGRDLRGAVFHRVSAFSLRELERFGASSLLTRTTNDVAQVQQVVFMMQRMMAKAPLMAAGGIAMALVTEPRLSWILLVTIPAMALVMVAVASRGLPLFKSMQGKLDGLNRVLREGLSGLRVTRAFDRVERERERFDAVNADLTATGLTVARLMAFVFPFVNLLMNAATVAIVWYGGLGAAAGDIGLGSLVAFIQYASQVMFSVIMVSVILIIVPRAQVSAERIAEVLDVDPEIKDPAEPRPLAKPAGRVEFRDVGFGYPGAAEPALSGVSFTAEPGRVTAIIGGTGSGKSTVLNLIARFYDVGRGAVLVDGVDVRDLAQAELRSLLGLATQKAVLFSGSVAETIGFGLPGDASPVGSPDPGVAPERQAAAAWAAEVAQASGFIAEREGGMDAPVARGGTNLSGGQKQRLAIARALARRPRILLLDDSFSALDYRTDARLRAALRRELAGTTVIVVAQRVATVRDADHVVVLDEGRVVGAGRHEELLASCPVYREIAASQLGAEEAV